MQTPVERAPPAAPRAALAKDVQPWQLICSAGSRLSRQAYAGWGVHPCMCWRERGSSAHGMQGCVAEVLVGWIPQRAAGSGQDRLGAERKAVSRDGSQAGSESEHRGKAGNGAATENSDGGQQKRRWYRAWQEIRWKGGACVRPRPTPGCHPNTSFTNTTSVLSTMSGTAGPEVGGAGGGLCGLGCQEQSADRRRHGGDEAVNISYAAQNNLCAWEDLGTNMCDGDAALHCIIRPQQNGSTPWATHHACRRRHVAVQ